MKDFDALKKELKYEIQKLENDEKIRWKAVF